MQRELKFRVWDKFKEEWKPFLDGDIVSFQLYDPYIDDYTVQQYTGLKDKNGKEIYEGDIVHYVFDGDSHPKEAVDVFLVCVYELDNAWYVFNEKIGVEGGYYWLEISGKCDVVGNIFENPKLLKN